MNRESIRHVLGARGRSIIRASDGKEYVVPHPEFVLIGRHNVVVEQPNGYLDIIDPLHIVSIRPGAARKKAKAGSCPLPDAIKLNHRLHLAYWTNTRRGKPWPESLDCLQRSALSREHWAAIETSHFAGPGSRLQCPHHLVQLPGRLEHRGQRREYFFQSSRRRPGHLL